MSSTQQLLLGEGAGGSALVYIEDVFSTYLYTGTNAALTITNGIDLSTKGGLVWIKSRTNNAGTGRNSVWDTVRGRNSVLITSSTGAADTLMTALQGVTSFNTTGFSLGTTYYETNYSGDSVVSWTFREQPKFFDIVTYTGNGSAPRAISHNLGSTPGCIMIKRIDDTGDWWVFHRGAPNQGAAYAGIGGNLYLNYNDKADSGTNPFLSAVSSTTFTLSTNQNAVVNISSATYVAYVFAHDAGGFGLAGTDNVITCGSYVGNGNTTLINIGYEPQWILIKNATSASGGAAEDWKMIDNMRGFTATDNSSVLVANTSGAQADDNPITIASQGFNNNNMKTTSQTYIYIAIRRGPMKVPTVGTSVFIPMIRTGTNAAYSVTGAGFTPDAVWTKNRTNSLQPIIVDRLRALRIIKTSESDAESAADGITSLDMDGFSANNNSGYFNNAGASPSRTFVNWLFQRAPGFFDEVCYTGTGVTRTVAHNLAVVPELMIFKVRASISDSWQVYCRALSVSGEDYVILSDTAAAQTNGNTRFTGAPTSTLINLDTNGSVNGSGNTYVAYLFATLAGISKVGLYTGTGTTLQINCGFTAGARFVMIKRTNTTGDWYVWDSARGIISGDDPYLLINSSAVEVTNTDYVDTYSAGFEISSTAPAAINANGGTFIFLAIA